MMMVMMMTMMLCLLIVMTIKDVGDDGDDDDADDYDADDDDHYELEMIMRRRWAAKEKDEAERRRAADPNDLCNQIVDL